MPRFKVAVLLFAAALLITAADRAAFAQLAPDPAVTRYVVAPQGNEARYRVREQLAGIDFPNDAVGKTTLIEGGITVTAIGAVIKDESKFSIDLASLTSDKDRRVESGPAAHAALQQRCGNRSNGTHQLHLSGLNHCRAGQDQGDPPDWHE